MKRKILVTGVAGSGKSTVCSLLAAMGHEAYGIEDIDGMFGMYRKDTGERYTDYDNADPEKIKNADWLCDVNALKVLLNGQQTDLAFYCGVASNMDEIMPLFDKILMLKAGGDVIHERLTNREGSDDIGNTEASRQAVLSWKDWWENEMAKKGVVTVDAHGDPETVAKNVASIAALNFHEV